MPYPTDKPKAVAKKPAVQESSDDSESDAPIVQKKAAPATNLPAKKTFVKSENHSLKPETAKKPEVKQVAPLNKRAAESSSEDDDSDAPKPKAKVPAPAPEKKVKGAAPKPADSDEESDEAPAKIKNELPKTKAAPAKPVLPAPKKVAAPADSDESSDEKPAPKKAAPAMKNELPQKKAAPAPAAKKQVVPESDDDESEAPAPAKKAAPAKPVAAPVKKPVAQDSDEESDEKPAPKDMPKTWLIANKYVLLPQRKGSDAKKPAPVAKKPAAPVADSDEDSSDEKPAPKKAALAKPVAAAKPVAKKAAAPVEESDDDDDEDETPAPPKKAAPAKPAAKKAAPVEEEEDDLEIEAPQKGGFQQKTFPQRGGRDNGYVDKNATEIIVKGLNYTVTEDQIWERFGQYGTVTSVKCLTKDDGSFRGMCFIKMADESGVDAAVAATGSDFLGRSMWVEKTRPKSEREAQFSNTGGYDSWQQKGARGGHQGGDRQGGFQRNQGGAGAAGGEKFHTNQDSTIFVGNLSFNTREDSVWAAFESIGNLKEVRVAKNPDGSSRGFAHVEFHDVESATKGLGMTGTNVDGRPIRCDSSTGKSGGGNRGGAGGRGGFGGGDRRGGRGGSFRQHDERPTHSGDAYVEL